MPVEKETGWLIERGHLYLGEDYCRRKTADWVGNERAIRFARKADAENAKRIFDALGVTKATDTISEHEWVDIQCTSLNKQD